MLERVLLMKSLFFVLLNQVFRVILIRRSPDLLGALQGIYLKKWSAQFQRRMYLHLICSTAWDAKEFPLRFLRIVHLKSSSFGFDHVLRTLIDFNFLFVILKWVLGIIVTALDLVHVDSFGTESFYISSQTSVHTLPIRNRYAWHWTGDNLRL